jgi:hypothetical protein
MVWFALVSRGGERRHLEYGTSLEIWDGAVMRAELDLGLLYDFVMGVLAHDELTTKVRASLHLRKPLNPALLARQEQRSQQRRKRS